MPHCFNLSKVLFVFGSASDILASFLFGQPATDQRRYLHSREKRPDTLVVKFEAGKTTKLEDDSLPDSSTQKQNVLLSLVQHTEGMPRHN